MDDWIQAAELAWVIQMSTSRVAAVDERLVAPDSGYEIDDAAESSRTLVSELASSANVISPRWSAG